MNLKEITTALDQLDLSKYELIKKEEIADIHSAGLLLKHKKSGARVVVLSNDDENKVFSIGFKTPPFNDTGLQHIMEHSTLCGSRKYPVKDPFVELCKGSLNTFLNAMTYPDKTVYPVASCNLADFKNITDVYMDAVFYPNIYQREQIFKQEGWHYELDSIDSPLKYNGVVFNEMKGVYSSPDDVLSRDTFVYFRIRHTVLNPVENRRISRNFLMKIFWHTTKNGITRRTVISICTVILMCRSALIIWITNI